MTGIEPVTSSLPRMCSANWATWAAKPVICLQESALGLKNISILATDSQSLFSGAGDGIRTRDPQLGRLTLYHWATPALQNYGLILLFLTNNSNLQTLKNQIPGGEGRIRTSVGGANGFTARPLWPLGYLSFLKIYQQLAFS